MNKSEFLSRLGELLSNVSEVDTAPSLDYYGEMIDDLVEDGMSEEEAIHSIGTPEEIAFEICPDAAFQKATTEAKPKRSLSATHIVLLIVGSPIWLSLLIAAAAVVFSLYVSLWSVVVSLWSVPISLAACALYGVLSFVPSAITGDFAIGALMLGGGIACTGLSILAFIGCSALSRGACILTKKSFIGIKSLFVKRRTDNA